MNASVAVTQLKCKLGDVEANLRLMRDLAQKAGRRRVDVLCFPELVTTGYSLGRRWVDLAEPIPGPTTEKLGRIASDLGSYLIAGMSERDSQSDRVFDSAVLVDRRGEVAGVYRKVHLWDKERRYFTPGDEFKVFSTDVGAIGIGICYDLEFPETSRILALGGAEMIFFPAAEMRPFENHVDNFLRSRAAENGIFVSMSNLIGREGQTVFFGHSQIVSPDCRVVTRAKGSPGLATARLDLRNIAKERKRLPYLQQRMPAVYGALQSV